MKQAFTIVLVLLLCSRAVTQPGKVYHSLKEVGHPDSVYALKINHKGLREIPSEVFTYRNLELLDLGKNRIGTISPQITQLQHLKTLNLRRNRLRHIPAELGTLRNLEMLNLSRNPILDLPTELSNLESLKELIIWCTGIISFPSSFSALNKTLQLIDMRVCPMSWDDQQAIEEILPTPKKKWDHVCNCK